MANFRIITPGHPILVSCIDHYLCVSGAEQIPAKKIFPRPGVSLLLDFTEPFYCDDRPFLKALSGFRSKPFVYTPGTLKADHLAIQFSPYGLSRFTNIPLNELAGQILKPRIVFGDGFSRLYEQVRKTDSILQRIKLLEAFLIENYAPPAPSDAAVFTMIKKLRHNLNHIDFKSVKKLSSLSTRQVERKFKAIVGVDMQTYIRICRFDHAKSLLLQNSSLRLTDIGLEAGYYDQSHFSNDFKRISGVSPRRFDHCMAP